MKEHPIILSAESVRAVLEGRKTQTRRVVKPQPIVESDGRMHWNGIGWTTHHDRLTGLGGTMLTKCPYGRPGDRLWVRETWWHHKECRPPFEHTGPGGCIRYEATEAAHATEPGRWLPAWYERRSSIHMPRWASRLTLEVTGVRVERLQDITPDDARAEGHPHVPGTERHPQLVHDDAARDWFMDLWDGLNAKRGHSWASNPWVWVVAFKRVES